MSASVAASSARRCASTAATSSISTRSARSDDTWTGSRCVRSSRWGSASRARRCASSRIRSAAARDREGPRGPHRRHAGLGPRQGRAAAGPRSRWLHPEEQIPELRNGARPRVQGDRHAVPVRPGTLRPDTHGRHAPPRVAATSNSRLMLERRVQAWLALRTTTGHPRGPEHGKFRGTLRRGSLTHRSAFSRPMPWAVRELHDDRESPPARTVVEPDGSPHGARRRA